MLTKKRLNRKTKRAGNKIKKFNKNKTKKHIKHVKLMNYIKNKERPHLNLVKLRCSPKASKNKFTCFDTNTLYKLRDLWNARHPDAEIKTNDTKEIWEKLKNNMSNVCNKETCWLKQKFVEGKLDNQLTESFAPEAPKEWKKNPNSWLSSIDILDVMKQYEKAYKCFDFIGPSPIDFDTHKMYGECVWEELCHFNLENEIKNGRFKFGVIFNLDPHYKGGSHWVSLFVNVKKAKIFYFDSAGDAIPHQIKKFVDKVTEQGSQLKNKINFEFDQNYPVEHQYGDTECGVYSLYFIVHMLEDKHSEEYFKTHILKDEYMQHFRKVYFNQDL